MTGGHHHLLPYALRDGGHGGRGRVRRHGTVDRLNGVVAVVAARHGIRQTLESARTNDRLLITHPVNTKRHDTRVYTFYETVLVFKIKNGVVLFEFQFA